MKFHKHYIFCFIFFLSSYQEHNLSYKIQRRLWQRAALPPTRWLLTKMNHKMSWLFLATYSLVMLLRRGDAYSECKFYYDESSSITNSASFPNSNCPYDDTLHNFHKITIKYIEYPPYIYSDGNSGSPKGFFVGMNSFQFRLSLTV